MNHSTLFRETARSTPRRAAAALFALAACGGAHAFEVEVVSSDRPDYCDPLNVPAVVDELGPPQADFPPDEQALMDPSIGPWERNCSGLPLEAGTHHEMVLINQSGRAYDNVWFVADTFNSWQGNFDGIVNEAPAMRIDAVGANKPLVFESMGADGIFEAGELWRFRVYHWTHDLPPLLGSVGRVGELSLGAAEDSTASIIATPAFPEPPPPSTVRQCFYECKFTPDGGRLAEVTTLMIANGNPPPDGVHVPTITATAVILDGRENVIAVTQTPLTGRDLDELAVCATLFQSGIVPPPAGSIQVALQPVAGVPSGSPEAVDIWMKNVVGRMNISNPEPFAGRVTGVGKTICRDTPGDIVTSDRLLEEVFNTPDVKIVPPVLIEGTAEPDIPNG